MAKFPEKEYGENEFGYRENYFMNDFDEHLDDDKYRYNIKESS